MSAQVQAKLDLSKLQNEAEQIYCGNTYLTILETERLGTLVEQFYEAKNYVLVLRVGTQALMRGSGLDGFGKIACVFDKLSRQSAFDAEKVMESALFVLAEERYRKGSKESVGGGTERQVAALEIVRRFFKAQPSDFQGRVDYVQQMGKQKIYDSLFYAGMLKEPIRPCSKEAARPLRLGEVFSLLIGRRPIDQTLG